jgi:hypothetical protein
VPDAVDHVATPSSRVYLVRAHSASRALAALAGRGQVSWLGAPRRAFPGCRKHPSGISDASAPVHSGGTAPASHRTSLDHRPMNAAIIPCASFPRKRPLQSPTDEPPSSRGLGRRPLTAETGVRIPLAVLGNPALAAGFRLSRDTWAVPRTIAEDEQAVAQAVARAAGAEVVAQRPACGGRSAPSLAWRCRGRRGRWVSSSCPWNR